MKSALYWGEVGHWRSGPKEHTFRYRIFTFAVDLDELEALSLSPRLFAYEKTAVFSIRKRDYLQDGETLRGRVEAVLRREGVAEMPVRITLLTMPRYLGYVFNPVSFFVCRNSRDEVTALVTQVNNTFGETHLYPLVCEPCIGPHTWHFPKEFFVSPFFAREGNYSVTFEEAEERLGIRVDLEKDGATIFSGHLGGIARPLTRGSILATLVRYPITSLLTMPRIHHQAMKLYGRVGATIYDKPTPLNTYTIRSHQNLVHRARLKLLGLLKGRRQSAKQRDAA
jgi:cyclopropane-fatty-acyl-phospholipid synthase